MTYRKGFSPLLIEKNKVANLTSDSGWGCVIRCTQMLFATAFQKHLQANKHLIQSLAAAQGPPLQVER